MLLSEREFNESESEVVMMMIDEERTGYDIMIKFFCGMQNGGSGVAERPDS